jgi:transcriptional regulator with XRE-family HTH domain
MDARGIAAQTLAGRLGVSRATLWRLLNRAEESSRRVTAESLCGALELVGEERAAFMRECVRYLTSPTVAGVVALQERTVADAISPAARSSPGRDASGADGSARVRFGRFLTERLRAIGASQSWLARQIKVAPSTISRLARGKLTTTHRVEPQALCRALDLSAVDRRAFLALAAEAYLMPLVFQRAPAQLRFRGIEQRVGLSLEEVGQEVATLRARRTGGEVESGYQRTKALYEAMFQTPVSTTRLMRSPELAQAKLRVGFEYCEAQAAYLGWYVRVPAMIETLNRLENDILNYFPPKLFASEHGHLLNLRGPLYYKRPNVYHTTAGFDECIDELSRALDRLHWLYEESSLQVELLRNRAHAYLLRGNATAWQADLETARRVASGMRGHEGETFQALVVYSWGEGYKRLASRRALPRRERWRYADKALQALPVSEAIFHQHHYWEGYELLAQIAEAQCLIQQDADEALRRADMLRAAAETFYPSLLAKIDRVAAAALRHRESAFRL